MVLSAIICGHSFCKRLQVDMQAGTDARMRPSFKLEETARVRMLGKGGKTIGDFVRRDIPVIQRYRPDILILLLGDNDIGCDTSAEEIAHHPLCVETDSVWLVVLHLTVFWLTSPFPFAQEEKCVKGYFVVMLGIQLKVKCNATVLVCMWLICFHLCL